MTGEREWVASWVSQLEIDVNSALTKEPRVRVSDQKDLLYALEVEAYSPDHPPKTRDSKYTTDVLIWEESESGLWTPRVVIETKMKSVGTHGALTYSAKAATHKQVHPYIRYGILIGGFGNRPLPARLFRHGAYFDFMVAWEKISAAQAEWTDLIVLLVDEIEASRNIEDLLKDTRKRNRPKIRLIHRPFRIKIL